MKLYRKSRCLRTGLTLEDREIRGQVELGNGARTLNDSLHAADASGHI